jgi:hypothetical protein
MNKFAIQFGRVGVKKRPRIQGFGGAKPSGDLERGCQDPPDEVISLFRTFPKAPIPRFLPRINCPTCTGACSMVTTVFYGLQRSTRNVQVGRRCVERLCVIAVGVNFRVMPLLGTAWVWALLRVSLSLSVVPGSSLRRGSHASYVAF